MPYNPMKKHMDKIDEWASPHTKKLTSSRDAGPGVSMTDRLNIARGKDDRWNKFQQQRSGAAAADEGTVAEGEDPHNIVPNRSRGLPPPRPNTFGSSSAAGISRQAVPPPPPQRSASGTGAAAASTAAASPASRRPAPPSLPRRMDNEAGIDKPPPPYVPSTKPPPPPPARKPSQQGSSRVAPVAAPAQPTAAPTPAYIEFSKFTEDDKEAFFEILDEFFSSRKNGESSEVDTRPNGARAAQSNASTFAKPSASQHVQPKTAPKPTAPKPKSGGSSTSLPKQALPSHTIPPSSATSRSYPRLSASLHDATEICTALQCASFFIYRDSYPEWAGPAPWYTASQAKPASLNSRSDVAYSMSMRGIGDERTIEGGAIFSDLSLLWWQVSWRTPSPLATVHVQAAFKDRPDAWSDEDRLVEANRGFGDWIAGFAEDAAQRRQPVGDGECWTLAAEAIKYTNATAQLTEENRLLTSIGRTHGHLIYGGRADPIKGQCGRWRGEDRVRAHWGGIRRGDIVEWRSVRCREVGAPKGSYSTLGAPDHTAVVVDNSPVPEHLGQATPSAHQKTKSDNYYALLGIRPKATHSEIRAAYLQAARRHHPDRGSGAASSHQGADEHMQMLNAAHTTLSNPSARQRYDEELASGHASRLAGAQGGASNAVRVSATVDLDAMEIVDDAALLTFHTACRCGGGFYVNEEQLANRSRLLIGCSGCSERIRVVADGAGGPAADEEGEEDKHDNLDGVISDGERQDQPSLAPWELGRITVIEQSAGQAPTRRTYDLGLDSFTQGDVWVFRPVWERELLGGVLKLSWPPTLPGWQML